MEKKMENDMETAMIKGIIGVIAGFPKIGGTFWGGSL